MYIQKNRVTRRSTRRVVADEELDMNVDDIGGEAVVAPEATDLLFEAEDVAELVAEVTDMPVEVEVAEDGDSVVFAVGEDEYTVEAEGDEEILEAVRINRRKQRPVAASKANARSRKEPVKSSRTIRKVPSSRKRK